MKELTRSLQNIPRLCTEQGCLLLMSREGVEFAVAFLPSTDRLALVSQA